MRSNSLLLPNLLNSIGVLVLSIVTMIQSVRLSALTKEVYALGQLDDPAAGSASSRRN